MHAIVNHFPLQPTIDWADLVPKIDQLHAELSRQYPHFHGASLLRVDDASAIFLAFFATREALDDISKNVAGPWFAEHVRPHLAGPVDRHVGEIVAGFMK